MNNTRKAFIHEDFLLESESAKELYHDYAKNLPIIDYHNHLPPNQIASNHQFENLTQIWLAGDHYKWRAMRAFGIEEKFITGKDTSDWEKFDKYTETLPYTLRNPLYHWSQLELKRYFDIDELLTPANGKALYQKANEILQSDQGRVWGLLSQMNVEILCTTDDPVDDLQYHKLIQKDQFGIKVLPAFRPDAILKIGQPTYTDYIEQLAEAASMTISSWDELQSAIVNRMEYFHAHGCRLSDHGLNYLVSVAYTEQEIDPIFKKALAKRHLEEDEIYKFQAAVLHFLATQYHEKGWVQQYHLGALRNQNRRLLEEIGADVGCDSIGDFPQAQSMGKFFNHLDQSNQLAKTIIYNLNPADNEVFATLIGNYSSSGIKGKMQMGSAWWFLDQLDGMEKQINALSNMGLLSCFVGMLTDSRSFLSFPRHEYFRRLLCNIIGKDLDKGYLPNDMKWIGKIVKDICYHNAKEYFEF